MLTKIKNKALLKGLFAVYLLALFWIILLKLNLSMIQLGSQRSINLIPFAASALVNGVGATIKCGGVYPIRGVHRNFI